MPETNSGIVRTQFVATGTYPTRSGNHVRPWIDGEPAFRRIGGTIDAAEHQVWVTVTFMWPSFRMPDGRGAALDMLHRAALRGVDVRIIFWRPGEELASHRRNAFWGSPDQQELLSKHYPNLKVRWDSAAPGYCQHQKTWLIDPNAGHGTSFVGGINLNPHSVAMPGHAGVEAQNHDAYVEVAGPAVADVQHNFVQRWNEASERARPDGLWGHGRVDDLPFPNKTPPERGTTRVQIQRTVRADRYRNGHPPVGAGAFDIGSGERTNLDQYRAAIDSARCAIYMENQYLEVSDIVASLDGALKRGIEVVTLLPAVPELPRKARTSAERKALLAARARLADHDNFTLAGIAALGADGRRAPVYVHAKLMLVDDEWATVGSCNLHHFSLFGNSELNAAFHAPETVRAMRVELFQEHLGMDTANRDCTAALRMFRRIARENRNRHDRNDSNWQGLAFSLDARTYGVDAQF